MPVFPVPLVGQSYQSRSVPLSSQATRNLYPEPVAAGLSPSALLSWPGSKLFSSGTDANRGMHNKPWLGYVFTVEGTKLYKTDSTGTKSEVGDIPGKERCIFAGASYYLYVVTDGKAYRTDGTTVEELTDEDLESPDSVAFLNSFLIYDGAEGRFWVSDAGNGSSIDADNYASAESYADSLTRVYAFRENLLLFGTGSLEQWYYSGIDNPPYDRYQGSSRPLGIAGVDAVTETDKAVYFLGHDRSVYRLEGYEPVPVSSVAISGAIEGYSDVSDCFAISLKIQGQSVVIFNFPSANKSWAYSETFSAWFEISSGVKAGRHLVNGYCFAFGKHLITDYRNGNIYEWDLETYTDNGDAILRERVTQPLTSELFGVAGKTVFWNRMELIINSGYGAASGQGVIPQVMMQYSDDGGHTWSPEQWASAGELGSYRWRVEWFGLGSAESRVFRFKFSDPVPFHMFKLNADVELGL